MISVFADLDGFLSNFVAGACVAHGSDLHTRMGEVRRDLAGQLGIDPATFWGKFGRGFWADLPTHDDGFALLAHAELTVGAANIGVLTSPCDTDGCTDGKRDWVARHLPEYKRRLFVGSAKELFAGKNKVLIDDHDANVDKFVAAGGRALLVPRPWNRRRDECNPDGTFVWEKMADELAVLVRKARK